MDTSRLPWILTLLWALLCSGQALASESSVPVRQRVLTGFDGLRFGASLLDVRTDLGKRDAVQFETSRMVNGEEIRYRLMIGDLPFDVFLSFDPKDGWRRALVQLASHTFGQTAKRCAALHERVLYLVTLQHGEPDQRIGPGGPSLPPVFVQRADFRFINQATVTVHNRFDADTCYNYLVYDATTRRPVPSAF